jgi:hypothetical protein
MTARRVRRLGDELIRDLRLDESATTKDLCYRLCEVVGARIGRELRLHFAELPEDGPSAAWGRTNLETTDGRKIDIILCARSKSWVHRLLLIIHEIAHILCEHAPAPLYEAESSQLLFPDLTPEMAATLLRTHFAMDNSRQEREAEHVASRLTLLLTDWAERRPDSTPPSWDGLEKRLWWSFGAGAGRAGDE